MLWRLAMFTIDDIVFASRRLPVAISSVRNSELSWRQWDSIVYDIELPFLNELDHLDAPQQVRVTGFDNLSHLRHTYRIFPEHYLDVHELTII